MVLLEKLWDDVIAGPHPENGLGKLRRKVGAAKPLAVNHGSNINTKTLGANLFDKPHPNSPTVYDWYFG
ncbi:hypothetical protein KSP40_PGU022287 [Platanthera guangdongensis]|uniref:Auxin-repressed protein n=1 Tax=Platanthera guangdongensis TaxID=2320717 RepID=A0ABR2M855_9ASPA